MKHSVPHIDAQLRALGLRRTPVRVGVLELLQRASRPLSVPQILAQLKGVDTVTVYRTLNTFIKKRLVHRVRGEDRSWLYAAGDQLKSPRHLHPHFVCEECGKVDCLEESAIPGTLVESLHVNTRYRVAYPEVVLHGKCPKCNE